MLSTFGEKVTYRLLKTRLAAGIYSQEIKPGLSMIQRGPIIFGIGFRTAEAIQQRILRNILK